MFTRDMGSDVGAGWSKDGSVVNGGTGGLGTGTGPGPKAPAWCLSVLLSGKWELSSPYQFWTPLYPMS